MEESASALQLGYHVSRSLVGRRRLALRTGLTEMATRLELERLRDRGFVVLGRSGAALTPEGRRHFARLLRPIRSVTDLTLTSLRIDEVSLAAHLAATAHPSAWTLRDEAIREGATGLLLLRFRAGAWRFAHDDSPIRVGNPDDERTIDAAFPDPRPDDLLLVTSAPDRKRASLSLWRVVLKLLPGAT